MATRYAWVIDINRCIGCRTCMVSCKMENLVAPDEFRIRVLNKDNEYKLDKPEGTYPRLKEDWLPVPCQHCENPPCLPVCPIGASYIREDGIVTVDESKCIGCQYCVWACPYDARFMDPRVGTVDKCTMCYHRLSDGKKTMCESCCPGRALHVGDLNDPESEVSRLVATRRYRTLLPEQGTKPATYYLY